LISLVCPGFPGAIHSATPAIVPLQVTDLAERRPGGRFRREASVSGRRLPAVRVGSRRSLADSTSLLPGSSGGVTPWHFLAPHGTTRPNQVLRIDPQDQQVTRFPEQPPKLGRSVADQTTDCNERSPQARASRAQRIAQQTLSVRGRARAAPGSPFPLAHLGDSPSERFASTHRTRPNQLEEDSYRVAHLGELTLRSESG
jgi:hypothetical protein